MVKEKKEVKIVKDADINRDYLKKCSLIKGNLCSSSSENEKILMFYGTECVHCHEMFPYIERLEKEEKVKVEKLEIWHDSKNKARYDKCNNKIKCTGVPFFYNENTKKSICGAVNYFELKKWAKGN